MRTFRKNCNPRFCGHFGIFSTVNLYSKEVAFWSHLLRCDVKENQYKLGLEWKSSFCGHFEISSKIKAVVQKQSYWGYFWDIPGSSFLGHSRVEFLFCFIENHHFTDISVLSKTKNTVSRTKVVTFGKCAVLRIFWVKLFITV